MTPPFHSYGDLTLRASNHVESVALFTDSQLIAVAADSTDDQTLCIHLLGEMLVRTWIYRCDAKEIEQAITALAKTLSAERLVDRFVTSVKPLRTRPWPVETESIETAFSVGSLAGPQEQLWSFLRRRVGAFLTCDGIIPAVIAGDSVAIPFTILRHLKHGKIVDADGKSIEGWVGEAHELWKTLGRRFDVQLGCSFGRYSELWNGKSLVSGGSFALPILFAATRSQHEDTHPLDILCTGAVLNDQLREIGGRDEKNLLADRMNALFVAPGIGEPWFLSPSIHIQEAIAAIWKRLGKDAQEVRSNISNAFAEPEDGSFARDVADLTRIFVGRDDEVQAATTLIYAVRGQEGSGLRLWIGGEAGCGKSAFIAALVRNYSEGEGWYPIPYFFGKVDDPTEEDFFRSATMQLTATFDLDLESVRKDLPEEQFLFAVNSLNAAEAGRVLFFVDGLNEANGPLDSIVEVARKTSRCIWIFSGQDTRETAVVSNSSTAFPEGGLARLKSGAMRALIRADAPGIAEDLVKAIVEKADGLPLYSRLVVEEWRKPGVTLDPMRLPDQVQDYYGELIESIVTQRHRREAKWRGMMLDMFAVFATSREHTLTAATVTYMLSRTRRCSESDVCEALGACSAVMEEIQAKGLAESHTSRWRFRHHSFRQFLLRDESIRDAIDSTRIEWFNLCNAWNSAELEPGARAYALRFLITELADNGKHAEIIKLAKNISFLDKQSDTLGPRFTLGKHGTLARGLEIALRDGNLADAASLTLVRAQQAEQAYSESPLAATRRRNNSWAMELIERIENQNDRTLWQLALAAWHADANRLSLAARILDNEIPLTALREEFSGGASLCAAVLLTLLTDVWTRRFQWGRFLSRLDDDSKQKVIPLLVNPQRLRLNATWQILGSIKGAKVRDNARQDVVRELASFNPGLAERQLVRFESNLSRAWAAADIAAAYLDRQKWAEADRIIDCFIPKNSAQHAKALAFKSASLKRNGFKPEAASAGMACLRIVRKEFFDDPAQQAKSYAEFAKAETEAGFVQHATFGYALENAAHLSGTHIKVAKCITSVVNSLAPAVRHGALPSQLREAIDLAKRELASSPAPEADRTRFRLIAALARSGHFELAKEILPSIKDEAIESAGAGRLCSYLIHFDPSLPHDLYRKVRKSDHAMLFHGVIALEKAKSNPSAAVSEICQCLPITKVRKGTRNWGAARVLGEAGLILSQARDERAEIVFEAGRKSLERVSERYRGRYLVNLASLRAESGNCVTARENLAQARACVPEKEEDHVALLAEIESVESRYHLDNAPGCSANGVVQRVKGMANDNLVHKLELCCQLISPLAEADRCLDLEDICQFALGRIEEPRFLSRPEQRSRLAGRFAGKLSKSALKMNGFREITGRFVNVCQHLEHESGIPIPDDALRAETLMQVAEGEFNTAVVAAQKIGDGEIRSIVFRDLAIRAVREGNCEKALHLCTRITHERSQHLPNIGREMVARNDKAASGCLHQLMILCSEYPDAAYRIISSFIRFHKPASDVLFVLLASCGLYKDKDVAHN
jgi:hypothetical protein